MFLTNLILKQAQHVYEDSQNIDTNPFTAQHTEFTKHSKLWT